MQGNDKVIEQLNKILSNELRAINQYFLHSRMLSDWGLDKFAQYEYTESMDEMKHADVLIQRILFLEGLPNMRYLGNVYMLVDMYICWTCICVEPVYMLDMYVS